MRVFVGSFLNWLGADNVLLGVPAQNWMLVIGAGLVLYIVGIVVAASRRQGAR